MGEKRVGVKIYEAIGDDYLRVNVSEDGSVLEIEQWDSLGRRMNSVNFFTTTAPKLLAQLQKGAGTKQERVEYEYCTEITPDDSKPKIHFRSKWGSHAEAMQNSDKQTRIVRRRKPGKEEYVV